MDNVKNALFAYANELEYRLRYEKISLLEATNLNNRLEALIVVMRDAGIFEEYMDTPIEGGHYYD